MERVGIDRINNDVYKQAGDIWWDENQPLNLLQTAVNPARVGYFKRLVFEELKLPAKNMKALEVGCGGGILCEEIAGMGFATTGIDPSDEALKVARGHASQSGLNIDYVSGTGEKIPFADASFDVVFCCDVLEHVTDLHETLSEISRVLKPGGYFFYDTINRTVISKLVAIKIWQDWSLFSFMPKDLHVWSMFIKPSELLSQFGEIGLEQKGMTGIAPGGNLLVALYFLRKHKAGKCSMQEMGSKLNLRESRDKNILYAGYARKI